MNKADHVPMHITITMDDTQDPNGNGLKVEKGSTIIAAIDQGEAIQVMLGGVFCDRTMSQSLYHILCSLAQDHATVVEVAIAKYRATKTATDPFQALLQILDRLPTDRPKA